LIAGRYALDREIGRGGMGAVWLARDEVLGRDVAVKRVGMVPGGGTPDLERAEREARLAARLNHPHVVAVFDLVHEDDEQWLVMEYVPGFTLADLVRRDGALTPDQAAPMLGQAADALAAAHSAGIVHRDVKPSNILVTADGQVKLSDFGIARAEADASLTQTGLVTGSPAYLAPEVASGGSATDASDVWSLGATLFHALSGHPPYEIGDNLMGALYRIVHEEPPRLPNAGWLRPLLESTMTRNPADRWSMARVRDFLASGPSATVRPRPMPVPAPAPEPTRTDVIPAAEAPVVPASRRRRSALGPILVGLVVLALVGIIAWALLSGGEPEASNPPAGNHHTSKSSSSTKSPNAEPSPSADDMEDFIANYLATATSDPDSAFQMLTPQFQEQSGGLEGYRGFWDTVKSADLVSIQADPQALTVQYTVDYTTEGPGKSHDRESTDDVSLALDFEDGTYKIAAEG
jgi:serine/threonine protein kinase